MHRHRHPAGKAISGGQEGRTNGKAERFIKILLEERAYVMHYGTSAARNELLQAYLRIYNGRRGPMALGGLTPQQWLAQLQA
ncbi:integrase core domain-containing protein [Synechococcus sp. CCY 9618]|uniref:integrase core domain-containing protein n=1 Tax=Synechococcus sp. CCY 9618 TaxID=2815602 RepID=UPI001C24D227|nr:integrase core domain-containing protein [Synechococcus sp. CCY 9618]